MRPTGLASHTDRRPDRVDERLGRVPGRSSYALVGVLLIPFLLLPARPAQALELLSWWRRDLLELRWDVGDWATYRQAEFNEEGVFEDVVTVRVFAASSDDARWIEFASEGGGTTDRLLIRPGALRDASDPLAAVDSLLRREGEGDWIVQDVDAYRDDRLVQRHLSDPFVEPTIARSALADTTIAGRVISRERFDLDETRREERSLGRSQLVVTTRLHATAVLSRDVPLAGILRARSIASVTTTTEGEGSGRGRRGMPPLVTERTIECIAFGRSDGAEAESEGP